MTERTAALIDLADALDVLRRRAITPTAIADLTNLAATSRRLARRHMH